MPQTIPEHERFILRPRAVSVAVAAVILMSVGGPVAAQSNCNARSNLSIGHAHGVAGQIVNVALTGRSVCEVNGFGLVIGHDPNRLDFLSADPGQFLVDYAGDQLFVLTDFDNDLGLMILYVAFDFAPPLTILPRSVPFHSDLFELRYRVKSGAAPGTTHLINQSRRYGSPPISNVYTTAGREINPVLTSGSITIQAFSVDAGDDQSLAEGSFTILQGSASGFRAGATPTYRWTQISGPLAQQIDGSANSAFALQLPQVTDDQLLVFELEVNDDQDSSKDTVEIIVLDSDARGGELRLPSTPVPTVNLTPSTQALAFVGQLEWRTEFEDGIWSEIRFQVNSHAVLDEIARASLYLDVDQSGDLDGGDRLLGSINSPFAGGQTSVSFTINERLQAGAPIQFLLIVERSAPAPARQGSFPIWPALVVLAAVAALRRAGVDLRPSAVGARCLGAVGVALSVALLVPACSSGGGGGSDHPAALVFSIDDELDIDLRGESSGTPGSVSGLPLQGPELKVQ